MHYIVYNHLIYPLTNEDYLELMRRDAEWIEAIAEAQKKGDEYLAVDEYNNLHNYLRWIEENIKPVSIKSDNFDLHRYDKVCQKCSQQENEDDLPF